jgi:hypothetical protein
MNEGKNKENFCERPGVLKVLNKILFQSNQTVNPMDSSFEISVELQRQRLGGLLV